MINACNKPKHGGPCKDNGFVFRKVTIPAQLGDDKTGQAKPENGAYTNSMVVYEASGAKYIYDSNGVYTILSEHPVYSVNKKTGAVVLKTSDIENDSDYVNSQFVDDAVDGAVTLEATLREASDDAIEQKLEDAVTGLNGRLLEETTLRKTSDDAIKEQIAEVAGDVADETSLRQDADSALEEKIEAEATTRTEADTNLQSQIDAISVASDVVDVVGTKTELDNYDTSALKPNDIIKVLQDESEEGATTYYRWSSSAFTYIGSEGPYYTKSEADTKISEDVTDAINEAVFASQENRRLVQIGAGADAKGNGADNNIAIGVNSKVGVTGVAIAGTTTAAASVAPAEGGR